MSVQLDHNRTPAVCESAQTKVCHGHDYLLSKVAPVNLAGTPAIFAALLYL